MGVAVRLQTEEHRLKPVLPKSLFRTLLFLSKWCLSREQIVVEFIGRLAAKRELAPARPGL